MRIGMLARLTGTTNPIILSYESAGLIKGSRRAGLREFGPETLDQVKLILACRSLKWSLSEIKTLMTDLSSPESIKKIRTHLGELSQQLQRLELLEKHLILDTLQAEPVASADSELMTIAQLADQTGLSRGIIDSFVNKGLLTCIRRPSTGYRDFSTSAPQRIELILALRSLGFSIAHTKTTLDTPMAPQLKEKIRTSIEQRHAALSGLAKLLQEHSVSATT